jgi:hypothetical protein
MAKWQRPTPKVVHPLEYTIVYKKDDDGIYVYGTSDDDRNPLLVTWIAKFGLTPDVLIENQGLPSERRTKILRLAELWGRYESDRAAWEARHALIDKAQCEAANLYTFVEGHFHGVTRLAEKGYDRVLLMEAMRVIEPTGHVDRAFAERMIAQGQDRELLEMAVQRTAQVPPSAKNEEDIIITDGWE